MLNLPYSEYISWNLRLNKDKNKYLGYLVLKNIGEYKICLYFTNNCYIFKYLDDDEDNYNNLPPLIFRNIINNYKIRFEQCSTIYEYITELTSILTQQYKLYLTTNEYNNDNILLYNNNTNNFNNILSIINIIGFNRIHYINPNKPYLLEVYIGISNNIIPKKYYNFPILYINLNNFTYNCKEFNIDKKIILNNNKFSIKYKKFNSYI